MKKLVLFVALLLSCGSVVAQRTVETVYLKNGGIVKGEIIEQVPNQSLKVRTKDGNVFVYQMEEVERIVRENSSEDEYNRKHRGLDFKLQVVEVVALLLVWNLEKGFPKTFIGD